jgi:hypothetical protein
MKLEGCRSFQTSTTFILQPILKKKETEGKKLEFQHLVDFVILVDTTKRFHIGSNDICYLDLRREIK